MGWLTSYFQQRTSGRSDGSCIRDSEPCGTHELFSTENQRSVRFFLHTQFGIKQDSQTILNRKPSVSHLIHSHAIRNQAELTSYFNKKPSVSQIVPSHAYRNQAQLACYSVETRSLNSLTRNLGIKLDSQPIFKTTISPISWITHSNAIQNQAELTIYFQRLLASHIDHSSAIRIERGDSQASFTSNRLSARKFILTVTQKQAELTAYRLMKTASQSNNQCKYVIQ